MIVSYHGIGNVTTHTIVQTRARTCTPPRRAQIPQSLLTHFLVIAIVIVLEPVHNHIPENLRCRQTRLSDGSVASPGGAQPDLGRIWHLTKRMVGVTMPSAVATMGLKSTDLAFLGNIASRSVSLSL